MTKIVADITMSLDGFVTGPNAGPSTGSGSAVNRSTRGRSTATARSTPRYFGVSPFATHLTYRLATR